MRDELKVCCARIQLIDTSTTIHYMHVYSYIYISFHVPGISHVRDTYLKAHQTLISSKNTNSGLCIFYSVLISASLMLMYVTRQE